MQMTILNNLRTEGFDYVKALADIIEQKHLAQLSGNESEANRLWAEQTVVEIHQQFIKMYTLLTDGEYYDAWCLAAQIEVDIRFLSINSQKMYDYVKDLGETIRQLQILFPYRVFASYVMDIKQERCSICGKVRSIRGFCGHREGRVYNGELCCNVVEKADFKGVDIVLNPVNKFSVLFPSSSNGMLDEYDYSNVINLMLCWKSPFQHWEIKVPNTNPE